MRSPKFSVGQPVFIRWAWNTPYNIIDIDLPNYYFLQDRAGRIQRRPEHELEPLKIETKSVMKQCITVISNNGAPNGPRLQQSSTVQGPDVA